MSAEARERREVAVRGVVQGVGFRPFVYSLARRCGLAGWVRNDADGVHIQVEGRPERLESFLRLLQEEPPPLAVVEAVRWHPLPPRGERGFSIHASRDAAEHRALISPDVATCDACLRELFDPADRRYRYPFINCTHCGPRFTITRSVPYDRARTTMAGFPMCAACQSEYDDPANRRFHAQPNACPACGPRVRLVDVSGRKLASGSDPITVAARLLREGSILAVKGLGGYHLACDPFNASAVSALRSRKVRQDKPFALMARDLEEAGALCEISPEEAALLEAPARPIVLLTRRRDAGSLGARVDEAVAPRQTALGVMLAYTPLHHLLLRETGIPLVMTSGNRCDEPIAYRDDEALEQLGAIADAFLVHNRPIHMRCDDSVIKALGVGEGCSGLQAFGPSEAAPTVVRSRSVLAPDEEADDSVYDFSPRYRGAGGATPNAQRLTPFFIRRSRGYAPRPLSVSEPFSRPLLACGGELKATFCLAREGHAFPSHHIGDLENYETYRSYVEAIQHYIRLFDVQPQAVACDLHPEYLSTKYARELAEAGLPLVAVQHHEAHVASCLSDNERPAEERVVGVALDGTGYGPDGAIWGGEFFTGSVREGFVRRAHLGYVPLPGGAAAVRQPWRMAVSYLLEAYGPDEFPKDVLRSLVERDLRPCMQMCRRGINSPPTSSAGRLFDAVATLLGLPGTDRVTYEGQAAIELELAADGVPGEAAYPFGPPHPPHLGGSVGNPGRVHRLSVPNPQHPPNFGGSGGALILEAGPPIRAIVEDLRAGRDRREIAARFHASVAAGVATCCGRLAAEERLHAVALAGGVFQNRLLTAQIVQLLQESGLTAYVHRRVPPNDGGLALGQAVLADARLRQA